MSMVPPLSRRTFSSISRQATGVDQIDLHRESYDAGEVISRKTATGTNCISSPMAKSIFRSIHPS